MGQPIPPRRRIRRRFSPIMVAILGLAVIIVWFVLVKASGLMLPLRLRTTVARWDVVEELTPVVEEPAPQPAKPKPEREVLVWRPFPRI
jgi:hypothetical protein